jgi:Fe-S-cluster-containing dehydrogenase component
MDEHPHRLPVLTDAAEDDGLSRRRFLALVGASAAVATGAGCKLTRHREAVVPYTRKQEEIVPGVADHYASTFAEGEVAYPVLVKTREGRPIHIEGNDEHPLYRGKTQARASADLLGLYDPDRLRAPSIEGRPATWDQAIRRLVGDLQNATAKDQGILLMTPAVLSPSRGALLARWREALPGLQHIEWEPAAEHAGRQAARELFGEVGLVQYRFDRARVILSLEADFLGTHGDTVAAIGGFASMRRPEPPASMNRLYVLEGGMSLTGSKADVRMAVRPSALARIAFALVREVHLKGGRPLPAGLALSALDPFALQQLPEAKPLLPRLHQLVQDLCAAGDKSLVLAGPVASSEAHAACAILNNMLGGEGSTVLGGNVAAPALATPEDLKKLVDDMSAGKFACALFWDVNPAYDYPDRSAWASALNKVPLRVRMGLVPDETAELANMVLPINHWLESWNDFQTSQDVITLQQPVVAPLYDTLQGEDIFVRCLAGMGRPLAASYLDWLKQRWRDEVQPKDSPVPFAVFWNASLHDGLVRRPVQPVSGRRLDAAACTRAAERAARPQSSKLELALDLDARLYDGRYANNGWLQELPDPVTKVSWGNPLLMAIADADRLGLKDGDMVSLGKGAPLPIVRQRGQAEGVLRLALGHGRWQGSVASAIGTRAWDLATPVSGRLLPIENLRPTGVHQELALAQSHDTQHGRDLARQWSLTEFAHKRQHPLESEELPSLYPKHEQKGPRWGMAIDLSACVGCEGCMVACQSENNVPVVGPEQVRKGRAMHWIRIDRYYEGAPTSPAVVYQPMLCQQCGNAPCETVCPVNATNQSPDGLNQMAYNRCVGTRYCANNCPYKVRRFNFLDFTGTTPESMQLAFNPEVTVRPRGVMEKCTFCVQRIRNAEQVARREGRPLREGDVVPACAAACPSQAIVFGDINNPDSAVSKIARSHRSFRVLEELNTQPALTYLAALKNPPSEDEP